MGTTPESKWLRGAAAIAAQRHLMQRVAHARGGISARAAERVGVSRGHASVGGESGAGPSVYQLMQSPSCMPSCTSSVRQYHWICNNGAHTRGQWQRENASKLTLHGHQIVTTPWHSQRSWPSSWARGRSRWCPAQTPPLRSSPCTACTTPPRTRQCGRSQPAEGGTRTKTSESVARWVWLEV